MIKHATLSLCTNLTEQDMFEYYCHLPFISNYSKAIHSFLTVCSQKGVATVNMLSWVKLCGFSVIEQKGTATQKWTGIVEQDFVLAFIICHAVSIHTGAFPSSQLLIVVNLMNQDANIFIVDHSFQYRDPCWRKSLSCLLCSWILKSWQY